MTTNKSTPIGADPGKGKAQSSPEDSAGGTRVDAEARVPTDAERPVKPVKDDGDRIYVEHWGINE